MAKWEYEVSQVDNSLNAVREDLATWESTGWELVSTSTFSCPVSEGSGSLRRNVWQLVYVHYWRRKIYAVHAAPDGDPPSTLAPEAIVRGDHIKLQGEGRP